MDHYFSTKPKSRGVREKIRIQVRGVSFYLYTASGVFSKTRLDPASRLLIESVSLKEGMRVLDLGCGYGVVGVTLKILQPALHIVLSDVNKRALALAKANLKLNDLNADVIESDAYENIKGCFDMILVNPPQKAGKDKCAELVLKAPDYLGMNGKLFLVGRHNKGGKHLQSIMKKAFGNAKSCAHKGVFRVYCSERLN